MTTVPDLFSDPLSGTRCRLRQLGAGWLLLLAGHAHAADPCDDFVRWLPALSAADCRDAQLQPADGARSVRGQPIYQRDVAVPEPRLRVLVVGGMHGDEMSASALALRWLALAQADPAEVSWRFIPVLNPDGMFRTTPQRTNARGVDLNRNFPTPHWQRDSRVYWEQRTRKDPRRYPGPRPLSEPESRHLNNEMDRFQPHLIVSVHAPYGLLDFDGPAVEPPRRLGRLHLDQLGVYPGSLGNYGGVHRHMPVVTIELASATALPQAADVTAMWADLLVWMRERLPNMAPPPLPEPVTVPWTDPSPELLPAPEPTPQDLPWADPLAEIPPAAPIPSEIEPKP
ncbi:MAG: M14 family zinc carboxypeptidase [Pseudomonadota bacterium]